MSSGLQGIGDWHLLEVIGEGEHCTVYRGRHEPGGESAPEMAIKVLKEAAEEEPSAIERFEHRARHGALITSPRVVTQRGLERADGHPFGVWDLVEGASLDQLLPGKKKVAPLPTGELLAILEDALGGLADAQATTPAIAHGAFDAGSVLVGSDGRCRLMGFGTPGDGQGDLLNLVHMLQPLSDGTCPELDAWFDARLEPTADASAAKALELLPQTSTPEDRAALGVTAERARKRTARRLKKQAKKNEQAAPAPKKRTPEDAKEALGQARWVALFCVVTLLLAVLIEILLSGR